MGRLFWTIGLIVLLQMVLWLMPYIVPSMGLIWIFIESIYHLPLSWIGEPLFRATEVGPLPTVLGRLVTPSMYIAIAIAISASIRRLRKS